MAFNDPTRRVSDPESPEYDRGSPIYDATQDSSSRYYLGTRDTAVESGEPMIDAVRDVATGTDGSWVDGVRSQVLRDTAIQRQYSEEIRHSTEELVDGVPIRQPPSIEPTAYQHMSHPTMDAMIRQNADPSVVAQSSEAWVAMGDDLAAHQDELRGLIDSTHATWQGPAADAARAYLAKVARWIGDVGKGAQLTGRQQEIHAQVLNETQKRMAANPPVPFDVRAANAHLQTITDPAQYMRQYQQDMAQYTAQKAAQEQAARLMSDYDTQVGAATSAPAFGTPPALDSGSD